jgi:PAS domain S-box-containing protein
MDDPISKWRDLPTQTTEGLPQPQPSDAAPHEQKNLYRLIAENVSDVIFTMDMNLRYTYISPSIERLTGFTVAEAMKQSLHEILTPPSIALALKTFQASLERERLGLNPPHQFQTMELERRRKDGSTIWVETHITYLRDETGYAYGILGISRLSNPLLER